MEWVTSPCVTCFDHQVPLASRFANKIGFGHHCCYRQRAELRNATCLPGIGGSMPRMHGDHDIGRAAMLHGAAGLICAIG